MQEDIAASLVSGYDLRLLADLAESDPGHAPLPADRIALYRAILDCAIGFDGQPLHLEGLKQLAWSMLIGRRRKVLAGDETFLGAGTLALLAGENLRILRAIGPEYEFRHDQMRSFLAALWLFDETPSAAAICKTLAESGVLTLSRREQEELWRFLAALPIKDADLAKLWNFASTDPEERAILLSALWVEADRRGLEFVRKMAPA